MGKIQGLVKQVFTYFYKVMRKHIILAITLLFTLIAAAQPKVTQHTLSNGLRIYIAENHDIPQVAGAVAVRAGSKNDPADATGMAHYLEHMLFKGTTEMGTIDYTKEKVLLDSITYFYDELGKTKDEKLRKNIQLQINDLSVRAAEFVIPNEIDRMLSQIGGTGVNAYTTLENTVYHNNFPSNQMEKWLEIYSHRFEHPVFRLFQAELEIVYEEKNRGMDDLFTSLFEKYYENFFKVHPYGQQTTIGTTEHLKNPSLRKMYEYYNTYYVPNNMCIVLVGDVYPEEVIPMIEEKFGDWKRKEVPVFPEFKEEPFKGKEKISVRRTPIRAAGIGYRTPPQKHPDLPAIAVINNLLSNKASSGYIDKLVSENKIMEGGIESLVYNDYGATILYFIPKIFGQRMARAEKLVMNCLEKIKKGDFTDAEFEAVKKNIIADFEQAWENNYATGMRMVNAFTAEEEWNEVLNYPKKIEALTKEKIIEVANTYFGPDCLAMYSRMGFPKKDKLKKPGFEPVAPKKELQSEYYKKWNTIKSKPQQPKFVDIDKEVHINEIQPGVKLYQANNPYNNIFSLYIRFGNGKHYDPILKYAPAYLQQCGTKNNTSDEFNDKMYALGCTFGFGATDQEFIISIHGLEESLEECLKLIHELLITPRSNEKILKRLVTETKAEIRLEKTTGDYYSNALTNYILYGEASPYLTEMSLNELKKHNPNDIIRAVKKAINYEAKIYYTGKKSLEELKTAFAHIPFSDKPVPAQEEYVPQKVLPKENTVYLLKKRNSRQSKVHFFIEGRKLNNDDVPLILAFNKYFGGDMSSIMFQEIREFRSLAYSTHATYYLPARQGQQCWFHAAAGTQNDKTIEVVENIHRLIQDMPIKPERMEAIRGAMIETTLSARPSFRSMIATTEHWKRRGFNIDPNSVYYKKYQAMTFDEIVNFHASDIKGRPYAAMIMGNPRKFDADELKKYGKVKKVKKRSLYKK